MVLSLQKALTLNTSKTEQLHHLERHLIARKDVIQDWFQSQWKLTPPPVYGSIDLRNAGFKLAPIDMNLFPAGFNNINPDFLKQSSKSARDIILNIEKAIKKILILTESHTRNLSYWANVKTLQNILSNADFEVRIGTLNPEITQPQEIQLQDNDTIMIEPLLRKKNQIYLTHFIPDLILLNNDLSAGIPDILLDLEQLISPPVTLGWSHRLKSEHFHYYAQVAKEFAKLIDIDPWLFSSLFTHCGQVDFMQQEGMDCVVRNAEFLFSEIKKKYNEFQIHHEPFVIVKADSGTYGMAVMTVRNIDELISLNRKQRAKMAKTKGGQPVTRVIIQEGIYTFETFGSEQAVAEPVIYLFGSHVIGGFYRIHQERGIDENLNSPGMRFEPLAFSETCDNPNKDMDLDACPNRFYTYGIIARLSMLAAAREVQGQLKK